LLFINDYSGVWFYSRGLLVVGRRLMTLVIRKFVGSVIDS
jgi:hypothetical protein